MSYVSIASAIVTKLEEVTELSEVYDHEPKELLKYPVATVTAQRHENTYHDLAANKRTYYFTVRVYFGTADAQDGETILRDVVDKIITKLEGDVTIGGSCDYQVPISGKWGYIEREMPLRYAELTIGAIKRVNR